MPTWTDTWNKTGQGLARGGPLNDSKSKYKDYERTSPRVSSWKKSLDETGAGLLRGLRIKKEKSNRTSQFSAVYLGFYLS